MITQLCILLVHARMRGTPPMSVYARARTLELYSTPTQLLHPADTRPRATRCFLALTHITPIVSPLDRHLMHATTRRTYHIALHYDQPNDGSLHRTIRTVYR